MFLNFQFNSIIFHISRINLQIRYNTGITKYKYEYNRKFLLYIIKKKKLNEHK